MKIIKKSVFIFCAVFSFFLFGCNSIKQPESIVQPVDYTNEDVVKNEIGNIQRLMEKESTKALFRAYLLQNQQIFNECAALVQKQAENAVEEKDFVHALCLYKSLVSVDYNTQENLSKYNDYYQNIYDDVPGFSLEQSKSPSSIKDCINATVTIWVDNGLKVENGAGYADIVIGSGFFIDKRGYIITNNHVIEAVVNPKNKAAAKLFIKLPSDTETKIPAKVVGYDSIMDLALLKAEIEPEYVLELGSSSDLEVGDRISAIGTPIGLEGTLTSGIISSTSRTLLTMGNVFQIDAAVNSGNSGGPIIDSNKKVQAIVFAGMLQYQGLNFAIPVEYLKQELPLLYRGGEIKHSWIGSYGHTKKNNQEKLGLEFQYIMPGSSASLSGFQIDDVIISADNTAISTLEDFQFLCMKYEPGTILKCECLINGIKTEKIVYLEKRPKAPLKEIYNSDFVTDSFIPIFGIKMVRSSTTNKKSYKIEYVINGSTADENGFSENDNLVLNDVAFDDVNEIFSAVIAVQRRKKGFLDIQMGLMSSYDNPNYF